MTLSLDISIRCTGYCILDDTTQELVAFGTIKTDNTKGNINTRLNHLVTRIKSVVAEYKITRCVLEAPAFGARGAMSYSLFGVHFFVVWLLDSLRLSVTQYAPTSLKKFATGNGRASKEAMVGALPEDIKKLFVGSNLKKTTGLYDVTDAYFLGKKLLTLEK